jgi:hypothetical protein
MRCKVCGRFTSHSDYCPEHGKEFPDCKHFECPRGNVDFNICYPNALHSCKRARAEGECLGYEKGVKPHRPSHTMMGIVSTKTGEVLASGNTGLELMEAFSKTDIYKQVFRTKKSKGKRGEKK